jgi:1,4-dihydroxy-2-naphthoate octaprenyltransferase
VIIYGSNDVYDFDTGVDKNKKESVVNLVGRLVSLKLVFSYLRIFYSFCACLK